MIEFFNSLKLEARSQKFDFFSCLLFNFLFAVHGLLMICSTGVDAPFPDHFIDPQVKTWG